MAIFCVILFIYIFQFIDFLTKNQYIMECFTSNIVEEDTLTGKTTHTVNLPLNTTYSCKNFCGPMARCAITGEQCFADIDCPGCQPYSPPLTKTADCISGNNDAGKLTIGVTPNYSSLTSGYGTREKIITDDLYEKPPQANFGVDIWGNSFNETQYLFNKRYKPKQLKYIPNYMNTYSITGEFINDGPLPSNY